MAKNKLIKQRKQTYGTLSLIEQADGSLLPDFDIHETDGVEPILIERLKYALAGMAYVYDHNSGNIESLGKAFLDGIEYGMKMKSDKEDDGPKMGFTAKLKEKDDS